jgi:hypothetical protein
MTGNSEIKLAPGIALMAIISLLIIIGVSVLSTINSSRNREIVHNYTQETNQYILNNAEGLQYIFNNLFSQAEQCLKQEEQRSSCQQNVSQEIFNQVTDNLQDFSSTTFIRLSENNLQILSLSGSLTNQRDGYNDQEHQRLQQINSLLNGEVKQIPWQDYFRNLSGEEVVIPVKINNTIIGAIVRRVIE